MEVRSCHSSNDPPMAPRVKASLYNDLQALIGHDLPAFSPYILPFFRFLESVFPKTAASSHPLAASPMTPTLKTLFITANTPVFQTPSILITFCFFSRHSFCYIMKLFSYIDCFLSTSLPPYPHPLFLLCTPSYPIKLSAIWFFLSFFSTFPIFQRLYNTLSPYRNGNVPS